ncbi:retrovirus-related pol polyprotein LINE-1 [Tanacetum coccineum]
MCATKADQMWNTFVGVIRDVAKDSLGVASESARTYSTQRESWWFSEEVQTKVVTKQSRFKELLSCRDGNQEYIDMAKERANDIYKIAKARERRRRDIGNVRYIKDEGGRTILREEDIRNRWGEYLSSLFNESPPIESRPKRSGENKGDAQACNNYKGIKLLSHTMKLWERVIERRLRRETRVSGNQFGFMPGRPRKAYDSVSRELVWRTLIDKEIPRRYSRVINDMYEGAKTRVRTTMGNTEFFSVEVCLHQGSAISPYLFTLILDELSRGIQESIPWCMIIVDDIVLIAKSIKGLNNKLERWMEALEDNGLRVSREKTKYLRCDFGMYEVVYQEVDIRIGDRILQPNESFRYLGSVIHRSRRINEDVAHRIIVEQRCRFYNQQYRGRKVEMVWDVKRRPQTTPITRVEDMLVEGSRRRGRPKLRWEDRLKQDMKELILSEDITSDRNAWRDRIRISG